MARTSGLASLYSTKPLVVMRRPRWLTCVSSVSGKVSREVYGLEAKLARHARMLSALQFVGWVRLPRAHEGDGYRAKASALTSPYPLQVSTRTPRRLLRPGFCSCDRRPPIGRDTGRLPSRTDAAGRSPHSVPPRMSTLARNCRQGA